MIMDEKKLNKLIEQHRDKANEAYMNYQASGTARYLKSYEEHQAMADTLLSARDSKITADTERTLRTEVEQMYDLVRGGNMTEIDKVVKKIEYLHGYIKLQRGH